MQLVRVSAGVAGLASKLIRYSTPDPWSECVLWDGAQNHKGYGYIRIPRGVLPDHPRMCRVHRLSFWLFRGAFDLDLTVDHRCHTRLCVNPYHLETETLEDNSRDGAIYRAHGEAWLAESVEDFF